MKKILSILFLLVSVYCYSQNSGAVLIAQKVQGLDLSGASLGNLKFVFATVTPSTSNGYSIDISGCGFSSILNYQIVANRNTATASSCPNVSVKSVSTSAIVVNVIETNTSTQNVLLNLVGGTTSVLNGSPMVFASTSGLTLTVMVVGL